MIETLDRKYALLLLKRCLSFNNTDTLLIEYTTHEHDRFAHIVKEEAEKLGVKNIYVSLHDDDELHDYLVNTDISDIKLNPLVDRTLWDEVAKINGCVLRITTYIPGLMDDVVDKMEVADKIRFETSSKYYRVRNTKYEFPWVICAYPNKRWADYLFNNDPDSYIKLYNYIMQMCMVDKDDPIKSWEEYINKLNYYKKTLQELHIKSLHYRNGLGTDIEVGLIENCIWNNIDKRDTKGSPIMVNMPSYEIFTSPNCRSVNGIVYSSKPLIYNGIIIDKFYIRFKDGIVVDFHAEVGEDALRSLITTNEGANMLGEIALVNNNSPISNTGIVFYDTLFDENASCHFALGRGFPTAIEGGKTLTREELFKRGVNISSVHEDFMIGTPDMNIEASTDKGKVLIFKDGNFVI